MCCYQQFQEQSLEINSNIIVSTRYQDYTLAINIYCDFKAYLNDFLSSRPQL